MGVKSIRTWLGLDSNETSGHAPLRELVDALDGIDPDRARHCARFAYLLGRVAHADHDVSAAETRAMEELVMREGGLTADEAMLIVSLARSNQLLFGGTADYIVAQEFEKAATYAEKLALAGCLFSVASADEAISMEEETEIHRILNQLRIQPADLTALRLANRKYLPGLAKKPSSDP